MQTFTLDPRLAADTLPVARMPSSELRLMNDRRWPWLILVPAQGGLEELFDLPAAAQAALNDDTMRVAQVLKRITGAQKINVGALGNIVRQLHVHVVARSEGDAGWPGPVWGHGKAEPYDARDLQAMTARLRGAMGAAS
ncbi:HIT family protein [Aureimonas mangrovi]|uniref:HIT family protein n=1 Tax=Aureimonas mangrovi TaxID=2758041 RepID=UPI00163D5AC4|nr:HIT family protein [Aureimonas mangrovi]